MLAAVKSFFHNNKADIWEHSLATIAAVISRLSMLIITLINTQFFSPTEFGIFAVLSLIANIVAAFVSCGGDMWLNRFCRLRHMKFERAPVITRFYLEISITLAGFVTLCASGFAILGKNIFPEQNLAIVFCLLWAATTGIIETVLAILRSTNEIHRFFMVRDFFMPISLMIAIFVLRIDTALEFFLIAFMLWLSTLFFLLNYIFKRAALYIPRSQWTWQILRKELFAYTASLIVNNFTSRLAHALDTLLLAKILPIEIVGRYRMMSHFSNAFLVVQHFVFLTLPWHLRQQKIEGVNSTQQTVKFRQRLLLLSALPALIILIVIAKTILTWLGSDYHAMAWAMCALLLIRFGEMIWGPQHEKLISNNEVFEDTKANIVVIMSGLIIFLISARYFPIIKSAVIATAISSFLGQLKRFMIIRKRCLTIEKIQFPVMPVIVAIVAITVIYAKV